MISQNETATQLFTRLIAKKANTNNEQTSSQQQEQTKSAALTQIENILKQSRQLDIDQTIFSNGIDNKQIIEILGRPNLGKTELIMHLITRLLLPPKWSFEINNKKFTLNVSDLTCLKDQQVESQIKVILIETESKFSILRLFTIIENRLIDAYNMNSNSLPDFSGQIQNMMNKFIKECLKNLIIYKCDSNEQFILALSACDHYIQALNQTKSIIPVFIDTINSNYELIDKYNQHLGLNESSNFTENYAVILIKRLIDKYNICVFATRSEYINPDPSKTFLDYFYNSYQKWQQLVTKRIELHQKPDSTSKYLKFTQVNSKTTENNNHNQTNLILDKLFYSIQKNGFNLNK